MGLIEDSIINVIVYKLFKGTKRNPQLKLFSPSDSSSFEMAMALFGGVCNQLVLTLPDKIKQNVTFRIVLDSSKLEAEFVMEAEDRKIFREIYSSNRGNPDAAEWNELNKSDSVYGYRTVFTQRMPPEWNQNMLDSHIISSFRMGFPSASVKSKHTSKDLKPVVVVEFSA